MSTSTLPPPPSHEDPTSLGRDVFPLKLHGECSLFPPWLFWNNATVYYAAAHRLLSFVSCYMFNTFLKGGESQRGLLLCSHIVLIYFSHPYIYFFDFEVGGCVKATLCV